MGHVFTQKGQENQLEKISKKEEIPGYENLDRLTTPKVSTRRFQAQTGTTHGPNEPPLPMASLQTDRPTHPTSPQNASTSIATTPTETRTTPGIGISDNAASGIAKVANGC